MHLMIDLETMSTQTNAAIACIGAATFDIDGEGALSSFNQAVGLESNEKYGRHFSGSTVAFWLRQSEPARVALLTDVLPLHAALTSLQRYIGGQRIDFVWANSPSFDCAILRSAFEACDLRWPLPYWGERDVRTIKALAFPDNDLVVPPVGTHHNALDDVLTQIQIVQICHQTLNRR